MLLAVHNEASVAITEGNAPTLFSLLRACRLPGSLQVQQPQNNPNSGEHNV